MLEAQTLELPRFVELAGATSKGLSQTAAAVAAVAPAAAAVAAVATPGGGQNHSQSDRTVLGGRETPRPECTQTGSGHHLGTPALAGAAVEGPCQQLHRLD